MDLQVFLKRKPIDKMRGSLGVRVDDLLEGIRGILRVEGKSDGVRVQLPRRGTQEGGLTEDEARTKAGVKRGAISVNLSHGCPLEPMCRRVVWFREAKVVRRRVKNVCKFITRYVIFNAKNPVNNICGATRLGAVAI